MNDFQIGIIGGTRGMGNWFARFLKGEGYSVLLFGRNMGTADVTEMARACRVVVVSVPIGVTCEVIEKVGPHMQEDALLMDLTSLKRESVKAMLEASVSEVIGCHPLFGPQIDSIAGQRVVLCPTRGMKWLSWLKDILERNGALVVEATPEKHDQMMAIVQGLNHFNTIMMGLALSRTGASISELMKFSTPVFKTKIEIIKKVFCQNPRLYAEIIAMNPDVRQLIETYEKSVAELINLIDQGNNADIVDVIQNHATCFKEILS
jgi:prephenate dehydrogenase